MSLNAATDNAYTRLKERAYNKPLDMANGVPLMTSHSIKQLCVQRGGYETPELNDTLYLHFNGFTRIGEDLAQYSGTKALFMESNAFKRIENLEALTQLTSLFLQKNQIQEMENLESLHALKTLNLSENFIERWVVAVGFC